MFWRSTYRPLSWELVRTVLDSYCEKKSRLHEVNRKMQEQDDGIRKGIMSLLRDLRDFCCWMKIDWDMVLYELAHDTADKYREESPPKEEFKEGVVKFFARAEGKKFGFTESDVFFHMDNGIVLGSNGSDNPGEVGKEKNEPKPGDVIIFMQRAGKKGPQAEWWAYKSNYEAAWREVDARPEYRLRRLAFNTILWEGKDIDRLRLLYPKSWHTSTLRNDMAGYAIDKLVNGEWVPADDPR